MPSAPRLARRVAQRFALLAALAATTVAPAAASFHFMQIEQAMGGVCGDTAQQAIQLRMRLAGQEFVSGRQLKAWDANGANPVVLITFPSNVANDGAGVRILIVTSELSHVLGMAADFTMTQRIPDSYLAAGRLTFEDGFGTIYWSLSWGGTEYLGSNSGDTTNDVDGNFGPPVSVELPSSTAAALRFSGLASSASTSNSTDYTVSTPVTLTNNAGGAVTLSSCVFGDGFLSGDLTAWSASIP